MIGLLEEAIMAKEPKPPAPKPQPENQPRYTPYGPGGHGSGGGVED